MRDTQEQTSELLDLSRKMTAATDRKAVLNAAEQHFSGWKELYLCLVDRDGQGGLVVETGGPLTFSEAERAAADWAWQRHRHATVRALVVVADYRGRRATGPAGCQCA
ncbi:Sensor protein KdpD [Pseudomonas amygdali pv. mori]|uniref:Sensor protein KdpD n=1 Tax=Pseudomonas amygdali pv. mori TaxID=34065 RepID=A0A0P9VFU8_PSEA0|nr:Sensor protein KdpD [Pseudomonas amygdali pv. mori]